MLRVHSIETFGTHEGPGIRLVVFLQGCLLRCLYCHNPDTWDVNGGSDYDDEAILKQALHMRPYFKNTGGVTISGGEPLLQRKELVKLFEKLKANNIHTALDTNGFILDEDTKKLLELTDLVLLDVKHIDPRTHLKLTSAPLAPILAFAEYTRKIGKPVWLRYVLVPGYTDQQEAVENWAKHFSDFTNIERAEILPYHTFGAHKYEALKIPYKLKSVLPPQSEDVEKVRKIFLTYFDKVYVR